MIFFEVEECHKAITVLKALSYMKVAREEQATGGCTLFKKFESL